MTSVPVALLLPREAEGVKLQEVLIENFRGIQQLKIELDDTTVLIGENNTGKTAILEAIRHCLREIGPRRQGQFDPYDFHLRDGSVEPGSSPIKVELVFGETKVGEWGPTLTGILNRQKILQVEPNGRGRVALRVTSEIDAITREQSQSWKFLNLNGDELQGVQESALTTLQSAVSS